ncbi:MAG: hypothetical protein H0W25_06920 [Acidimicrobiia bacterium]|nr:hypothetical protein [Acidimicrobiia bacterium]
MALGPIEIIVLVVLSVGGVAGLLAIARRVPDDDEATLWARSRGLDPEPVVLALVRPELARTRRYRRTGAVLGFVGLPVGLLVSGNLDPVVGLVAGWAIGNVVAEAALRRRPRPGSVSAVASPRRLGQYASRHLFLLQAATVAGTLGATGWALTVEPVVVGGGGDGISDRALVSYAAGGTALAVLVVVLQRWVVARPQPVEDALALEVDDAFRSDSVHALGAAALALGGVLFAMVLRRPAEANVLNPWVDLASISLYLGSLLSTLWWANRAWAVRRPRPAGRPSVAA